MADSNGGWGEAAGVSDEFAEIWDTYQPIPQAGASAPLDAFIERKHISHAALVRLGARLAEPFVLAFIFPGGIKYRDLATDRRWSYAESTWTALKIVRAGAERTDTVIVAEGETDAAWLSDRVNIDVAVLPAGADPRPHTASYAKQLNDYRLVLLGHDDDQAGNDGAKLLADLLPQAVRFTPPANDWCDSETVPEIPDAPHEMKVLVPAGELLDFEPPPIISWYENGLLPVAGQLIIHGWAKSFKSFLGLDLLSCLAQGIPWCGFEPTEEPCRVAVAQYEVPWPYYQQRVRAMAEAAVERQLFNENFLTFTPMRRPDLVAGDTAKEDAILFALDSNDVQIFLLDPIRRATGSADLNSEKDVRLLLGFFQRCQDIGVTVIACHHDNKAYSATGGGNPLGMTGAGAFAGDADTIVSVSLPKGSPIETTTRNLHFTTRNAPSTGTRSMTMTDTGVLVYSTSPLGPTVEDDEDTHNLPVI